MLETKAPAKINVGLHILRRRPDGFHDLESVFVRIGWADGVSVAAADELTLACDDPALPTDGSNLVLKAALSLSHRTGITEGAAFRLTKRVPYGAGLGGGSSDAAAALRLLRRLWDVSIGDSDLQHVGAAIGSDVPFFLGPPVAFVEGRGERIQSMEGYVFPYVLVVVKPPVSVPTPEAYRLVRPRDQGREDLRAVVASNDLERWRHALVNDFEASVFAAYPQVGALKRRMSALGADYASMSGSGSAVFGVFEREETAREAAAALEAPGYRVWVGRPDTESGDWSDESGAG